MTMCQTFRKVLEWILIHFIVMRDACIELKMKYNTGCSSYFNGFYLRCCQFSLVVVRYCYFLFNLRLIKRGILLIVLWYYFISVTIVTWITSTHRNLVTINSFSFGYRLSGLDYRTPKMANITNRLFQSLFSRHFEMYYYSYKKFYSFYCLSSFN